jgi:hypothetical protein
MLINIHYTLSTRCVVRNFLRVFCYTIGLPVLFSGAHYEGKILYLQSEYRYCVYFFYFLNPIIVYVNKYTVCLVRKVCHQKFLTYVLLYNRYAGVSFWGSL